MNAFEVAIANAQTQLTSAYRDLDDEIHSYPTPISGCDAQFNYLLGERTRVQNALQSLAEEIFVPTPRMPSAGDRMESR